MDRDTLNNLIQHIIGEVELPNIIASLNSVDLNLLKSVHDSIHEFVDLASLCIPEGASWLSKGAFLTQRLEVSSHAHRALLEALSGFYNIAHIILRSTLELVIRGAFWECIAHRKFRENAEILENIIINFGSTEVPFLSWLKEFIDSKLKIGEKLENSSITIFDAIYIFLEDRELDALTVKLKPKIIIEQLSTWGILHPYKGKEIYRLYNELSREVHVAPTKTDISRRFIHDKAIFKIEIIPNQLEEFLNQLHKVIDIATVIELNILKDWINQLKEKTKLKNKIPTLEKLGLKNAQRKLREIIKR